VIVGEDASLTHFRRETVEELLGEGRFFWLDLDQPDPDDFEVLRDVFKFHPLAIEDSEQFGQRAKLDEYGDYVFLVIYGAAPDEDRLVEVHCFYSAHYLVTVHRDDCPAFREIRERYAKRAKPIERPALLLYRIVDGLVDSFFPILADFDDRIDELEDAIFLRASDEQLQEIFAMKRLFVGLRKAITPERDLFASLMGGVDQLPGMGEDDERYFRDVYDHLIRISDLIDTYRDLLTKEQHASGLFRVVVPTFELALLVPLAVTASQSTRYPHRYPHPHNTHATSSCGAAHAREGTQAVSVWGLRRCAWRSICRDGDGVRGATVDPRGCRLDRPSRPGRGRGDRCARPCPNAHLGSGHLANQGTRGLRQGVGAWRDGDRRARSLMGRGRKTPRKTAANRTDPLPLAACVAARPAGPGTTLTASANNGLSA
jgi:magnesium transporter